MKALLVSLLLFPTLSSAQSLSEPEVTRQHGLTTLVFPGELKDHAGEELVARLRRGKATALETPTAVGPDGACVVTLHTARLLLSGDYVLELSPKGGGDPVARQPFRLDDAAAAQAAAARMDAWYLGAARTFRQLSATLERRGAWHRAVAEADGARRDEQQERFGELFLLGWERALRMARMDLATYQRRLALPPRPELAAALLELVDLLQVRAKAWTRALGPFAQPPGSNAAVEAVAQRLLSALPGLGRIDDWRAGPLGNPPPPATPGLPFTSPLGFVIDVPQGAELRPPVEPRERLSFATDGVDVRVRVAERPDARTPAELARSVEVGAWESWDSYKRLSQETFAGGMRLEFNARYLGRSVRVIQRCLFAARGGRVISLLIFRDPDVAWPEAVTELERSFQAAPE